MDKKSEVKNIQDLRDSLLEVYDAIRNGKIGIREAKENANVAGKVMASAKLQLEYNAYMKTQSRIPFLEV